MSTQSADRITVGLVRGLHGLDGTVRVEVLTDDATRFDAGADVYVDGEPAPLTIAWSQASKPGVLVRFETITDRAAAEALRDRYLEATRSDALAEGTWYWHQIEGLAVSTTAGEDLGTVREIFRAGAGEVYVVRGGARGETLVPATRAAVVEIDPAAGRMVVDGDVLALDSTPPRRRRKRHELSKEERKRR